MKRKDNTFAVILIVIAAYLVINKLNLMPDISLVSTIFTVVFMFAAVRGLAKLHFCESFISLAIVGWINDEALGIEALTPWTLMLSCILLGTALDMIMKDKREKLPAITKKGNTVPVRVEDEIDGEFVRLENTFGSVNKYVNSEQLREAEIQNSFGECNVFFNNMTRLADDAAVKVENAFGSTNIYVPAHWNVIAEHSAAFGNVEYRGSGSNDPNAPTIRMTIESNFGETKVIYQ